MRGSGDLIWGGGVFYVWHFLTEFFVPTTYLAETKMSQQKNNQKVACNMSNLSPILVSIFSFLLLPTGSPLMKLRQFWPFQPPPDHTKCYLAAKSSPQPWIHTSSKIKNKFTTLPIIIIRGIAKLWKGRVVSPPTQIGLINHLASFCHH